MELYNDRSFQEKIMMDQERRGQQMIEMESALEENEKLKIKPTLIANENQALHRQTLAVGHQGQQEISAAAQAGPHEIVLLGQRVSLQRRFPTPSSHSGSQQSRSRTLSDSKIAKAPLSAGKSKAASGKVPMDVTPVSLELGMAPRQNSSGQGQRPYLQDTQAQDSSERGSAMVEIHESGSQKEATVLEAQELRMKRSGERPNRSKEVTRMKSLSEILGPSRVNRPNGYCNNNRGVVGEMSEPSAPAKSISIAAPAGAGGAGAGAKPKLTFDEALAFLNNLPKELRMKRPREKEIPGPSRVSRGPATSVQSTAAVGTGGAGAQPQLAFDAALDFVHVVKDTFKDDEGKHRDFMKFVKDWMVGTIDLPQLITRVKELFKGQPELVRGFIAFVHR